MSNRGKGSQPRYFVPPNVLREKCGKGGLDASVLKQAEDFINENPVDFRPYAEKFMKRLDKAVEEARKSKERGRAVRHAISAPVMELKANGAMFDFYLISDVAAILLNFLEDIEELNDDALDIAMVHRRTLFVIIQNELRGGGGQDGKALLTELHEACERYFKKHGYPET